MKKNNEPDVIRTRNLLIWSQTRCHCANESAVAGLVFRTIILC